MTRVKICGIRQVDEARAALVAGADLLGLVFYRPSKRWIEPEDAATIVRTCKSDYGESWQAVGVFVDEPLAEVNDLVERCGLDLVQACGAETAEYCAAVRRPVIRSIRVSAAGVLNVERAQPEHYGASRLLFDTDRPGMYGGTGHAYDWDAVAPFASQAILAGGLTPGNVAAAIATAHPWGVDVSSGVERDGGKDQELILEFLRQVQRTDGGEL